MAWSVLKETLSDCGGFLIRDGIQVTELGETVLNNQNIPVAFKRDWRLQYVDCDMLERSPPVEFS